MKTLKVCTTFTTVYKLQLRLGFFLLFYHRRWNLVDINMYRIVAHKCAYTKLSGVYLSVCSIKSICINLLDSCYTTLLLICNNSIAFYTINNSYKLCQIFVNVIKWQLEMPQELNQSIITNRQSSNMISCPFLPFFA